MADYPRLLNLDADTKGRMLSFLQEEIWHHQTERQDYVDEIIRWDKDYWATPSMEVRKFPFFGASNLIVPLTAISVEAVHARMMTTLFGVTPIVNTRVNIKNLPSATDSVIDQWVHYELMSRMGFYDSASDMILEAEKYGTLVGKSGYEKIVKKAVQDVGGEEQEFRVVIKDAATIDAVPGSRFYMRFHDQDPQTARWVGEEHSWTPFEVRQAEIAGLFEKGTFDNIVAFVQKTNEPIKAGSGQEQTHEKELQENKEPVWPSRVDFYELWMSWNIDGNEEDEDSELQVFYHRESNTIMGVRYNWYEDLHRPYRLAAYIPVEHRWAGIGIGKQNEQFQREVTAIHRQRLDNATIANMRMFVVHKLSGYGPNEPIFPGKMWFVDDMTHIAPIQLGEIYQSSFANEQSSLVFSQQRTGVNEVTLGMPQVGTPGTATSDLARIAEGNKKFDFSLKNIKQALNQLIVDSIINIKQFGVQRQEFIDAIPNGELINLVLQAPTALLRDKIIFDITLTGAQRNKLADRNNWKELSIIFQQYYTNMLQLAQFSGSQELLQMVTVKAFTAATEAMRQLVESYEVRNVDKVILSELEQALNAANQKALQGSNGQPVGQPTGGPTLVGTQ